QSAAAGPRGGGAGAGRHGRGAASAGSVGTWGAGSPGNPGGAGRFGPPGQEAGRTALIFPICKLLEENSLNQPGGADTFISAPPGWWGESPGHTATFFMCLPLKREIPELTTRQALRGSFAWSPGKMTTSGTFPNLPSPTIPRGPKKRIGQFPRKRMEK